MMHVLYVLRTPEYDMTAERANRPTTVDVLYSTCDSAADKLWWQTSRTMMVFAVCPNEMCPTASNQVSHALQFVTRGRSIADQCSHPRI